VWIPVLPPELPETEPLTAAGLRSAVLVPLPANGNWGALLEFFSTRPERADPDLLEGFDHASHAWGRTFEIGHMESALVESEARFRALFETAFDAAILADAEGRIVAWNASATRMFGYEASYAVGRPLTLIMPDRYRDRHRAAFARALRREPGPIAGVLELGGAGSGRPSVSGRADPLELGGREAPLRRIPP
jgi:PAS domain-containing protein